VTKHYDAALYVPGIEQFLTTHDVLPTGGAQTQVYLIARELARRGLSVCLLVFDLPAGGVPDSVDGVDILVGKRIASHQRLVGKLLAARSLRRLLKRAGAATIITRAAGPHVSLIAIVTKLSRRRFVYSSASFLDFHWERRFARAHDRALFRLGLRLADTIVVQTHEQAALCERRLGRTPVVIRSIAEAAPRREGPGEAFLWAGRVYPNKNAEAFVELARALPHADFWLVAAPSPGEELQLRRVHEIAQSVPNLRIFPPLRRAEVLELTTRSVAVVNTSEYEGMPNVFLEAWARGVPSVALAFDPDGIIERNQLGGFAHGSFDRLVQIVEDLWTGRHTDGSLADRVLRYAHDHHSVELIGAAWAQIAVEGSARKPEARRREREGPGRGIR
jgi:glycosyltransferase involved in cell wall biosynthesis